MLKYILISLTMVLTANADTLVELDIQSSIEMAQKYSPLLKIEEVNIEQLEHDKRKALGMALPQVSTEYTINNFKTKPSYGGFSLNSDYERTVGVTVSQALFTFGAVGNAVKAADAATVMAELKQKLTQREVIYLTKVSYYSVLLAEEQLKIAQESLKNAQDNLNILQNYFSSGRPPRGDVIRLQTDVALRKPQVEEAKSNLEQAKAQLKVVLGLKDNRNVVLKDKFKTKFNKIDFNDLSNTLLNKELQVQALEQQIEFNDRVRKAQRGKMLPSIGAFYSYSSSERSNKEIFDTDSTINSSVVGISVNWEIWNGGQNRAEYKKAIAEKTKAQIQLQKTKDDLYIQLKQTIQSFNTLQKNIKSDMEAVKLAQQSFRLSQNRFKAGKTSITELNSTEQLLTQSKATLALHKYQINQSYAVIQKLVQSAFGGK